MPNDIPSIDPTPLFDLPVAYWRSQLLFTALSLRLFDAIENSRPTAAELAAATNLPERSLATLLKALAAIRLLEVGSSGSFANSATPLPHTLCIARK